MSSISDTENLGVVVADMHNRDDCRQVAVAGAVGFLATLEAEAGAKNPITPCAARPQKHANADSSAPFMMLL